MFVGLCMQAGLKCVGEQAKGRIKFSPYSSQRAEFLFFRKSKHERLVQSQIPCDTWGRFGTAAFEEKLLQSNFLPNIRKLSIENRTLKCKRDGLKCVEDTFRPMHYGSISSINDLKYLKM